MEPFLGVRCWPISRLFLQDQLLSILGLPNTVVVPSMRWKHWNTLPIPIWSKLPLRWWGNLTLPTWPYKWIRLNLPWKNCALLLQSMVLEHQRGLTFPMNRLVLSRKSIQSAIIWPMPLASLTTIHRCNWPSMRQPLQMMGRGWVLMSSKVSMTIMIKGGLVSWKKRSKPRSSIRSISQRRTWLWSSKGSIRLRMVRVGWRQGKLLVKVPVSPLVPRQVRPKPQSMEANKPLIPMWWLMHRQTIQRLR